MLPNDDALINEYNHMADTLDHVALMLNHLTQFRQTKDIRQLYAAHHHEAIIRKNLKQIPTETPLQNHQNKAA